MRGDYRALRRILAQIPAEHMSARDVEQYKQAWARPGALRAMVGWYRALVRNTMARGGHVPPMRIARPTRVIWGERDFALDRACNETLPRYVRDLDVRYLPASHWVQMDRPDEVNRLLLEFFRRDGPEA